jgi:hypothetical protein
VWLGYGLMSPINPHIVQGLAWCILGAVPSARKRPLRVAPDKHETPAFHQGEIPMVAWGYYGTSGMRPHQPGAWPRAYSILTVTSGNSGLLKIC